MLSDDAQLPTIMWVMAELLVQPFIYDVCKWIRCGPLRERKLFVGDESC